jgi:hypothetical protein
MTRGEVERRPLELRGVDGRVHAEHDQRAVAAGDHVAHHPSSPCRQMSSPQSAGRQLELVLVEEAHVVEGLGAGHLARLEDRAELAEVLGAALTRPRAPRRPPPRPRPRPRPRPWRCSDRCRSPQGPKRRRRRPARSGAEHTGRRDRTAGAWNGNVSSWRTPWRSIGGRNSQGSLGLRTATTSKSRPSSSGPSAHTGFRMTRSSACANHNARLVLLPCSVSCEPGLAICTSPSS